MSIGCALLIFAFYIPHSHLTTLIIYIYIYILILTTLLDYKLLFALFKIIKFDLY